MEMGSCGDGDDKSKSKATKRSLALHLSDIDNHTFDCHFYSQSFSGGEAKGGYADDLQFLQSTMPFDDTVLLEDAFVTQVMNFGGQTQVVNLGGETQTLDSLDCFESIGTQWLDEDCDTQVITATDGGETKVTETMDNTGVLSDDDSANRVCTQPVDQENIPYTGLGKEFDAVSKAESNALSSEKCSSESLRRGFTSIRVASLRASGLAARGMAFKGINTSESQSLERLNAKHKEIYVVGDPLKCVKEIDYECALGKYDEQMKRLIEDNTLDEINWNDENTNSVDVEAEKPLSFASENEFVGLSYLDSREPEELSEANALDFVDRFLKVNVTEFDQDVDIRKSTGGKSKPVSIAKGAQTLAKSANLVKTVGDRGPFDWDDSREDEGGGEFFRKKKESFFGTGDQMCSSTLRDSRLVFHNLKENDGSTRVTTRFRRNLIKELDKASTERMVETISPKTRLYTRGKSAKNTRKCSPKGETENRVYTRQSFLRKKACSSNLGVSTRQSKQTKGIDAKLIKDPSFSSPRRSTENKNQSYRDLVKPELKRPKLDDRGQFGTFTPIACRTRQSVAAMQSNLLGGDASSDFRENANDLTGIGALKDKRKREGIEVAAFANDRSTEADFDGHREFDPKISATSTLVKIDKGGYPSQRTRQKLSSVGQEIHGKPLARLKRLRTDDTSTGVDLGMKRQTRASICAGLVLRSGKRLFKQNVHTGSSEDRTVNIGSTDINGNVTAKDVVEAQASKPTRKSDSDITSPRERCKLSVSECNTPVDLATAIDEASPICMGDEYLKHSCRKNLSNLSLMKEINSSSSTPQERTSRIKDLRRKRDMASVKVFFSHHLGGDIIKQQNKVLNRLGASVASSISDATHFVADKFVRTRHMLEAIAFGKTVVTHLWLDNCGQASCLIDERNYILRDAKKEKEFGFSLPVSLARASEQPLLKGIRVLITPNTKPGKEILASLVKAVHGLAVERMGSRSLLKHNKIEDDLLILSCEEDYTLCVPLLEKGAGVYSSELLLDGIVTQKLEYRRHRLFANHVRRTQSTMWLRKDGDRYSPAAKCN